MAGNRLSFVIALKFLTENFNRQATRVKSQLYTLQRHFLALASAAGVGAIGLNNFLSKMIETAKKTSQASIALQNVSGNMKAYAENQQWLLGIAKKYGVEINSLTTGFAKFKVAADISNMSMEDQRKIFESVSRATVAFGLSQEDQKGVFMALSQMMSKNKVMAEELRLQLAERIPVAIQAMAKAAGVTVNELDALMKQGKVLSSEVLPKFADALTEMTPNVNLDNLNKSLVDLSNIFTDLTRKLDVEGKFKSMVDAVAGALRWLVDNTKTAIGLIVEAFAALSLTKVGGSLFKDYQKSVDVATRAIELKNAAEQKAAESAKRAEEAKTAYTKAQAAERTATARLENAQHIPFMQQRVEQVRIAEEEITKARKKTATAERAMIKANKQAFQDAERAKQQAAKVTAETTNMAASASATGWAKVSNTLKFGLASAVRAVGTAIKAALSTTVWTAILTATMEIARRLWDAVKGARELRRQIEETESRIESVAGEDLTRLNVVKENFNISKSYEVRKAALKEINGILGTEYDITNLTKSAYDDINKSLRRRIELLVKGKQLENAIQERAAAEATINRLGQKSTTGKVRRFGPFAWNTGGLSEKEKRELDAARAVLGKTNAWIEANYGDIEDVVVFGGATHKNSGAGTAKIPVNSLTIYEDDVAATMYELAKNTAKIKPVSQIYPDLQPYIDSLTSAKRDTSGDWKLSPTEILEADRIFEQDRLAKLLELSELVGNDMGAAISEALANSTDLAAAIKISELKSALKTAQAELASAKVNVWSDIASGVEGVLGSVERLNEALKENADGWEVLQAWMGVFSTVAQGVTTTMEAIGALQEAQANARKIQAATNIAASQGEAIAAGVAGAAAEPMPVWAKIANIGTIVGAIMSAFAAIPKFAKGGVVGGNSTQGDKVLARLNSGEGVLTAVGMQSLHDASNPANSRNIRVTGVLVGEGRTLKAIIDKEVKYLTLTK